MKCQAPRGALSEMQPAPSQTVGLEGLLRWDDLEVCRTTSVENHQRHTVPTPAARPDQPLGDPGWSALPPAGDTGRLFRGEPSSSAACAIASLSG